jgi:hypothetical protein
MAELLEVQPRRRALRFRHARDAADPSEMTDEWMQQWRDTKDRDLDIAYQVDCEGTY